MSDDRNKDEQADRQWWSTPAPGAVPDPTVFNANPGVPQADPTLFNANPGVPPADPTLFNPNAAVPQTGPGVFDGGGASRADPTILAGGQQPYTAPPQGYGAPPSTPAYPQASAPAYPQASTPAHPQAGGYVPPSVPAYPQAGYQQAVPQPPVAQPYGYGAAPGYPPRPPQRSGGSTTWIVLGVLGAVVLLVGGVIAAFALGGGAGDEKNAWDGDYSMSKVTDACALLDRSVLDTWATRQNKAPEHTEQQPNSRTGGGSLRCSMENETAPTKYGSTDDASLAVDVDFASKYGSDRMETWKSSHLSTTGSGRTSGAVPGLGSEAHFSAWSVSDTTYHYTLAVKDSNVFFEVELDVSMIFSDRTVDQLQVATAAEGQARKVLAALRK
ncbi:hypothetical protein [Nocardia thailandica]|uniref:hypothetical protein n=1 Tax=Nocardia thailandica TaxID=257275 RepID=UPI0002D86368|nr:hypothetical protein [Nocardia thailandica]